MTVRPGAVAIGTRPPPERTEQRTRYSVYLRRLVLRGHDHDASGRAVLTDHRYLRTHRQIGHCLALRPDFRVRRNGDRLARTISELDRERARARAVDASDKMRGSLAGTFSSREHMHTTGDERLGVGAGSSLHHYAVAG